MIAERYELEEEIGRGGMGAVWRGRDTRLGRIVALKRLGEIGTADGPGRERAHREALLAARLNHANIVSVHDLVEDDEGWTWLVMEHVPGITLSQAIAKGSLQTEAIARIGRQVAEALAAAHAAGISHRDVKPSNILLTEDGTAKLSDFGIARGENDAAITRTGQVTGSPAYLPPEVARGKNGGPAGDMWSLGATLFHAASGHTPYAGEGDGVAVLFRIVHEPAPRLTDRGGLTDLVAELMNHEPDQRPDAASTAIALAVLSGDSRAEATQAISPLAGGPVPDPEATSVIAAAPAADSPTQAHPVVDREPAADRRRTGSRPWIIVAALVGVLLLVGALAIGLGGDDDSGDSSELTSEELDAFGREFVETAASDPDKAFELLTPEAQSAVGGIETFREVWEPAEGAAVTQVVSDTSAGTVAVACEWSVSTSRSSFVMPTTTSDEAVETTEPPPPTSPPTPKPTPTASRTPTPTPSPTPTPTVTPTPEDQDEDDEPSPEPEVETVTRTVTLHVVRDGDRLVVDQYSQR